MTQQHDLLPANAEINNQDLPAIPEGLGPTDIQRIRSDSIGIYHPNFLPTRASRGRIPCCSIPRNL